MEITPDVFKAIKKLPTFKGKIVTGSMVPIIQIGEQVIVDVAALDLRRFDIIVFRQNGKLVCHYLWTMNRFVEPLLLQTRNMEGGRDYPITFEDYLGKVISHRLSLWRKIQILLFK